MVGIVDPDGTRGMFGCLHTVCALDHISNVPYFSPYLQLVENCVSELALVLSEPVKGRIILTRVYTLWTIPAVRKRILIG